MGSSNVKYIKSYEDKLESAIKKGCNLQFLQKLPGFKGNENLFELNIQPYNWNIFHLVCWYGNSELLKELINMKEFRPEYLEKPDKNGEPPIVLAILFDNINIVKILIEKGNCQTKFESNLKLYRTNLNLGTICVYSDAINCFLYLFQDLNSEDGHLDVLYDLAKNKNSDNIIKAFEREKMDMDFDSMNFTENEPHVIKLNNF